MRYLKLVLGRIVCGIAAPFVYVGLRWVYQGGGAVELLRMADKLSGAPRRPAPTATIPVVVVTTGSGGVAGTRPPERPN